MSKLKTTLLIAVVVLLGLFISSQTMAFVCNVPSNRPTIQAAVSDPACDDPINVAAATYNENIVINRALTLMGAGSASTFINGVNTGSNIAVVNITAAGNVTLSGFTITNAPTTNDGDLRVGVLTNSSSSGVTYAIVGNKVVGTNDPDNYEDYGIYGQNGGKENLLIANNVVTQTGSNNILVETHQGKTDISYNTLDAGCYGVDPIFVMTHSGKDVSSLQKVHHNTIDMGTGVAVGIDPATGITFAAVASYYGVSPARFLANSIEITNNSMFNLKSKRRGIGLWNDATVGSDGNIINPKVLLNTITGAPGTVTASMGISTLGLVTNALVSNNTITGVDFSLKERIWNGHIATGTQLNQNNFSNNSTGVLTERTSGMLNAENNWWGCAAGPGNSGCDNASSNVDYDPWLTQPVELIPSTFFWKDYNDQGLGGYMPDIDQNQDFDKVVRTEQNGAGVSYTGTWTVHTDQQNASGGTLKYSNDLTPPEGSCSFTFNGTSISWIGFKQYNMGISEVWIDGNLMGTVDLYTVGSLWKQVLYTNNNLSQGQHTITIKPTNQHATGSSGYYTGVDAFDVDNKEQHYCAPVAEANSLWWLDKKYTNIEIFANPLEGTGYIGGDFNDDNDGVGGNILDLVKELAIMMGTNDGQTGTTVAGEQAGINAFLQKYQLDDKLYEHTVTDNTVPEPYLDLFHYIEAEVERSQDVKLDLGFWHVDHVEGQPGNWQVWWSRRGGHAVTVAGVDSQNFLLAISDPDNDTAEAGINPGVVRPVPGGHPAHPNDTSVHNIEANASHDIYTVAPSPPSLPSPRGKMGLLNFPWKWNIPSEEWEVVGPVTVTSTEPIEYCMTFTEIEAAVIVSPGDPDISVSPASLVFGNVKAGTSSDPQTVTVSNTGKTTLKIGTISPGSQFSKQNDNCSGQTITPSGSCTVQVKFSPTSAGVKNANLSIPSNDPDENPLNVSLSGTGTVPDISVFPTSLGFGTVPRYTESSPLTVTVTNEGLANLLIGTVTITGTNADQFVKTSDNCTGMTLAPTWTCAVGLKFKPTSGGSKSANLRIPSDDPDENPFNVPLSGTGGVPAISAAPASLNFQNVLVGGSSTKTITISNTGAANLSIYTIGVTGTHASQFSKQIDNCSGKTITPSGSCTVQVKLSPTSAGAKSANLNIPSDDPVPAKNPLNVSLKGTGAKIVVTSPNGGESLGSGGIWTITWQTHTSAGPVAKVVLKYTTNGTKWNSITTRQTNTGSYPWEVPWVISSKCKVKVILKNSSGATIGTDASDSFFDITY